MTLNTLKLASRNQFALNGYEGASLAIIANEVGIKKQSIYTYYKGKDELFLDVYKDSLNEELDFIHKYFLHNKDSSVETTLQGFLNKYLERYENEANTDFFLRTIFYPPLHLKNEISLSGNEFVSQLQTRICSFFQNAKENHHFMLEAEIDHAAIAFITLLDGLFVEILFGGLEQARVRLDVCWNIYWRGIS
ncbi:TetR/AcrR family transcriptional regulator [Bacillales bacterium AN1005]